MSEAIAYKFTGARAPDGEPLEYHYGIPARDLTKADVDGLKPELRAVVKSSNVYEAARISDADLKKAEALKKETEASFAAFPAPIKKLYKGDKNDTASLKSFVDDHAGVADIVQKATPPTPPAGSKGSEV